LILKLTAAAQRQDSPDSGDGITITIMITDRTNAPQGVHDMNAHTSPTTAGSRQTTPATCVMLGDTECWAKANEFLTELIGSPPDELLWDHDHRLQGHSHIRGCELVVIAPRDDDHHAVVLTAEDWDVVRRSGGPERRRLLNAYAISNHDQLERVLRRYEATTHGELAVAA
jgi:hypothetical protein